MNALVQALHFANVLEGIRMGFGF